MSIVEPRVLAMGLVCAMLSATAWAGEGNVAMKITDTSKSPHAKLDAVPVDKVRIEDGLWAPRLETNRVAGIPHQYEECERTGRIDNFRRAAGLEPLHPHVQYTSNWGIRPVAQAHPVFRGLDNPVYTVSPGLPTHDYSCYWDDPKAVHGTWLGDWENGGGKYVVGEYTPGSGKAVFVGTGAFYFDQPSGANAHAAARDTLTRNILAYLGGERVAFVLTCAEAELNAEEAAAMQWAKDHAQATTLTVADVMEGGLDSVDVVWWHHTRTMALPEPPRAEKAVAALKSFVEEGGGLLLTGFAPLFLHVAGWEAVAPTTIRQAPADGFRGIYFNDSDVHKWVEAAAISLANHPDPELDALLDDVIGLFAAAQQEDGYLDTYYMFDQAPNRWTNLTDMHELYIGGHMIQAAVAHHRATGKTNYLDVARKWADLCCRRFGPGKEEGTAGHPEVEMALVELYRVTGERKYLELARFFVEERGKGLLGGAVGLQDHAPIRKQVTPMGHAVRQLYLNSAVVDLYAETGDASLLDVAMKQWESFVREKMYITGGAGAERMGEAFGEAFKLPNDVAYAETCAAIASFMWNWRLLQVTAEARFADVMEQTLYNGLLSGVGLDGKLFFYDNPLEVDGRNREGTHHTCRRTSRHWDGCACCPPNVARTLAALPGYLYGKGGNTLYVHHYVQSTADIAFADGTVTIEQVTRYPWEGTIALTVTPGAARTFALALRYPGWAHDMTIKVNGEPYPMANAQPGAYVHIERQWTPGDTVTLDIPMPVRMMVSDPRVAANVGKAALMRGPVVYCVEATDHPGVSVFDLMLDSNEAHVPEWRPDLLGGVVVLTGEARLATVPKALYTELNQTDTALSATRLTAVPFHAWANREPGAMRIWLPCIE